MKCSLGVVWILRLSSLGVLWLFSACGLYVVGVFPVLLLGFSRGVLSMFSVCYLEVLLVWSVCSWRSLVGFYVFSGCSLGVQWVSLGIHWVDFSGQSS